jgi:hypothetical protein
MATNAGHQMAIWLRTKAVCAASVSGIAHDAAKSPAASSWSLCRHRPYAIIWTAALVSNVGGRMYS